MSSAFASSALTLIFGLICCTVVVGYPVRHRHTSRMWGTKLLRVDQFPWKQRELERRGYDLGGPLAGPIPMAAEEAQQRATRPMGASAGSSGGVSFRFRDASGTLDQRYQRLS